MDFGQFVVHVHSTYDKDGAERFGQYAVNELTRTAGRTDLYRTLTGQDFDPFYNDSNLSDFWDYLANNWYR